MAKFRLGSRAVALAGAIGLGGIATVGILGYIGSIESRALRGQESVSAFVAKGVIPQGTAGQVAISQGLIVRQPIPRAMLAEGSITSLDQVKDRVAAVNILKGEQILSARFVEAGAKGVLPIQADRQAVSVELGIPPGVAGFVRPGDRVSIIAHLDAGPGGEARVQYLLQGIEVLAIGQRSVLEGDDRQQQQGGLGAQSQQQRVLMTLSLTPAEAEKLVFALFKGQVYFTLLPPEQQPVSTPGRTRENAFA